MKKLQNQQQAGFTLIEAVVASALFAITVSSILGVYLSTIKLNRRTDVIRTASENARFITEYLSREIKNGQMDYNGPVRGPCTAIPAASANSLSIINVDGDHICFFLGDDSGSITSAGRNLWAEKNNLPAYKINSGNVQVLNLIFYSSPAFNPYTSGSTVQPRVTFTANIRSTSGNQDNVIIPIESSVTIPAYDVPTP
jgi:prepilin-type N-terminal cleavage/methylation domain-containing protein